VDKARNDLSAAVPKFCLALEEHRRTAEGRVRTSQEMLAAFFPYDEKGCTDKVFKYLPNDVRGPIVAAWGIRGLKAALRDTDDKTQSVVHDALVAGDIDHTGFEDALTPETLVRWLSLSDLWMFWRGGKLTKQAIQKALGTAYELYLFDGRWFLDTIQSKGGALKGADVLADGLTKEELTGWIRRIAETGDGSPKGVVAALGWDKIVAKTANEVLVAVLDAIVTKVGLATAAKLDPKPDPASHAAGEGAADDRAWSKPPGALDAGMRERLPSSPESPPSEEAINVVLEDELLVAPGALDDAEDDGGSTEVKSSADVPAVLRSGRK